MTYEEFVKDTYKAYPKFELIEKRSSKLMKVINVLLKIITFGQMKTFMTEFTTTIGYKVYTPDGWLTWKESSKLQILRHERVHMKQRLEKGGFWFSISYLLLPFPILWAWYRMKYEMEAYEESLLAVWELYGMKAFTDEVRENMIKHFIGAEYFWTWPWRKRIEDWYDGVLVSLQKKS